MASVIAGDDFDAQKMFSAEGLVASDLQSPQDGLGSARIVDSLHTLKHRSCTHGLPSDGYEVTPQNKFLNEFSTMHYLKHFESISAFTISEQSKLASRLAPTSGPWSPSVCNLV